MLIGLGKNHYLTLEELNTVIDTCLGNDDNDAWTLLIHNFKRLIYSIIHKMLRNVSEEDKNDIYQEVNIKLYQNLKKIVPKAMSSWLTRTTRNECLRYIRSGKREIYFENDILDEVRLDNFASLAELQWKGYPIWHILNERCQRIIKYYHYDGMSYDEIAQALGIKVGSVDKTKRRCIKKLWGIWNNYQFFKQE